MARYSRQRAVAEIGEEGQALISAGSVMVVGCGALGSMVAMQLAGAGVGTIGIADFDTVDISNLQRQFFFATSDAGEPKALLLKRRMEALNPEIEVNLHEGMVTRTSALEIFSPYDFIVDATDNAASMRMVDEVSLTLGKGCCLGGVSGFTGQVTTCVDKESRYSDIFPEATDEGLLPCSVAGVMGPAAAMVASIQAAEALKYLTKSGSLLVGRLLVVDLLKDSFTEILY